MKHCPDWPVCGHGADCSAADANELAPDPMDGPGTYQIHFAHVMIELDADTRLDAVFAASRRRQAELKAAARPGETPRHEGVRKVVKVQPLPID